jgi:hypothetical protein
MPHSQQSTSYDWSNNPLVSGTMSKPEREMRGFVDAVSDLIGPDQAKLAREVWLDKAACMDCMPTTSPDWSLVTLAAYVRLAIHPIERLLIGDVF